MSDIIVKENTAVRVSEAPDYGAIAIQWLESTGQLKNFTKNEQMQFIDICKAFGLNPIKREVYGIKYGNNFNIIVGYEVYLKRAERTGLYDGYETEWNEDQQGNLKSCTCIVWRKDRTHATKQTVFLSEYDQHNSMWKNKPHTMLEKVALAQAMRKAFPDELGGIPYTADELNAEPVNVTPAQPAKKAPKEETKEAVPETVETQPAQEEGQPMFQPDKKQAYNIALDISNALKEAYPDGAPVLKDEEVASFRLLANAAYKSMNIGDLFDILSQINQTIEERKADALQQEMPVF